MGFLQVENPKDEQKDALKNKLNLKGDQIGSEKHLWMTCTKKFYRLQRPFSPNHQSSIYDGDFYLFECNPERYFDGWEYYRYQVIQNAAIYTYQRNKKHHSPIHMVNGMYVANYLLNTTN